MSKYFKKLNLTLKERLSFLKNLNKNLNKAEAFWAVLFFLSLIIYNIIFTEDFFSISIKDGRLFGSIIDIFNRGALIMLLSIGMTLVFATGGVDLSVGSIMVISGSFAAFVLDTDFIKYTIGYENSTLVLLTIIGPTMFLALLAGIWNGILVAYLNIQPIVATLILLHAGRGVAQLITEGKVLTFDYPAFEFIGSGFFLGLPFPITITMLCLLLAYLFTRRTSLGLFIEAVGEAHQASYLIGIRVKEIKLLVYICSGLCAGIAGLVAAADISSADANNMGLFLELDAIAAVIIGGSSWGGRYTLFGSMIGALTIQTLTTSMLIRNVTPEHSLVYKALLVLAFTLFQSFSFRTFLKRIPNYFKSIF